MQQAKTFWDNAAENYASSPIGDLESYNYTLGRTRSYLSATDKLLEVGCGTGSTALLLAPKVDRVVASDISTKMIGIGRRKAQDEGISNIEFIAADLFDDAIDQGPYDVVLALNLLHLIEDTASAIGRINRLLKPDGIFISKTACKPGKGTPFKFRLLMFVVPFMQMLGKAPFMRLMAAEEFEDILTAQGFKILESGNHPAPSRYIVAKKI